MIVIDTSLIGPFVIPDEEVTLADADRRTLATETLVVPQHWRLEVANMLRTAVLRQRLSPDGRDKALIALALLPVVVDRQTWQAAWTTTVMLSDRHRLTLYDAAYLEVALRLSVPLATRDKDLLSAAAAEHVHTLHFNR